MKNTLLILFITFLFQRAFSQTDSTIIKLQLYKDLFTKGLIDSSEYVALKARVLDLNQQTPLKEPESKWKIDSELFYDVTQSEKILPKGLYMSMNEIKIKRPSLQCETIIKLRGSYDYSNGVGGNVMLYPANDCISKKDLKMNAWLLSDGTRCYVNLECLKLQPFYNPVITMGRFLAFYKNQPNDGVETAENWLGQMGRDIGESTGHFYRKLYVIDTGSDMLFAVDKDYMLKILKDTKELESHYKAEGFPSDNRIMAKYLQLVNDQK